MANEATRARALRRGPGFLGFLLAHHFPGELDRCYLAWFGRRPVWFCARCAGIYPVLLVVLVAQIAWPVSQSKWDWFFLFGLPLPAVVDWAWARIGNRVGSNCIRTLTGGALGASLGRTIYLNMTDPLRFMVVVQLAGLVGTVAAVEIVARIFGSRGRKVVSRSDL
ncbi:MAG TPA: DUF2085 domain-containing protein [Myxococcota bacterium]|nr:DUF2085 domain-containing protein [Myxococcota bacterium]